MQEAHKQNQLRLDAECQDKRARDDAIHETTIEQIKKDGEARRLGEARVLRAKEEILKDEFCNLALRMELESSTRIQLEKEKCKARIASMKLQSDAIVEKRRNRSVREMDRMDMESHIRWHWENGKLLVRAIGEEEFDDSEGGESDGGEGGESESEENSAEKRSSVEDWASEADAGI